MMRKLEAHNNNHIEETMSNLTSASNEASVSSSNRNDNGGDVIMFSPQYNFPPPPSNQSLPPLKKKRNQPGHPDPDAEVIALSPRTLLATNRFVCEVCSKGFQRDQNLQLHRRGHNLPWKLKQRSNKDVMRKKVYVCPETSCVHHEASRALGDLTGIKKHFCRKHGEKKWKCEKCSKKYAVQSDWKAHSKTCGTREYRCDCGTLFSRRDSFITHRAFCDALAEESARSSTAAATATTTATATANIQSHFINNTIPNHDNQIPFFPTIKKEQQNFMMGLRPADLHMHIPPWLSSAYPPPPPPTILGSTPGPPTPTPSMSPPPPPPPANIFQDFHQNQDFSQTHQNPNPNKTTTAHLGTTTAAAASCLLLPTYHPPPHISATALLQKAAQMGAKSSPPSPACSVFSRPHHHHHQVHQPHVSAGFGLNLSSRDGFINGLSSSYGNNKAAAAAAPPAAVAGGSTTTVTAGGTTGRSSNNYPHQSSSLFHDMMINNPGTFDHGGDHESSSVFADMTFGGILSHASSSKKYDHHHQDDEDDQESLDFHAALDQFSRRRSNHHHHHHHDGNIEGCGINDGMMTRDFLGLRALSQSDIMSIAGLGNCTNCTDDNNNNSNNYYNSDNACNDHHY